MILIHLMSQIYIYLYVCLLSSQVFNFSRFEHLNESLCVSWVWCLDKEMKRPAVLVWILSCGYCVCWLLVPCGRCRQATTFLSNKSLLPSRHEGRSHSTEQSCHSSYPLTLIFSCQSPQIYSLILYSCLPSSFLVPHRAGRYSKKLKSRFFSERLTDSWLVYYF